MAEIRDLQGSIEEMNRNNEDLSRRAIAAEAARADAEALHEATRRERSAIRELLKETSSKEQRKGKHAAKQITLSIRCSLLSFRREPDCQN